MTPTIICDIDGTIADNTHRLYLCLNEPKDYEAYHAATPKDKPMQPMLDLVCALKHAGYIVLFSTGRPELTDNGTDVRRMTENYLEKHIDPSLSFTQTLYMRPRFDHRPDYMVKKDNLDRMLAQGYKPTMVLDDRERCLDMYKDQGIFCLRIGDKGAY